MASATGSMRNSPPASRIADIAERPASRSRSLSPLTLRILAINVFALLMFGGGIIYLDQFRDRLIDQRRVELMTQARLMTAALSAELQESGGSVQTSAASGSVGTGSGIEALVLAFAEETRARVQIIGPRRQPLFDSLRPAGAPDPLLDVREPTFRRMAARFFDRMIEVLGFFPPLDPYDALPQDAPGAWPEVGAALVGNSASALRRLPDSNIAVSVAVPVLVHSQVAGAMLLTRGTRDITRVVRAERLSSFQIFCFVLALTLLLSSFLGRTIARPIRRLAAAADRVRLGRAREVSIPRFASRTDEIGLLARALSDMTQTLHSRMDAIEAFAADVSHELKNPLSSIRSAVETLPKVKTADQRQQLIDVIQHDVLRLDRLITDIAGVSRLDAELSRAEVEPVDLGELVGTMVDAHRLTKEPTRNNTGQADIAFARPPKGSLIVAGNALRLNQVVGNLIDNALSFAPAGSSVRIRLRRDGGMVRLVVDDDGPGIPQKNIQDIFRRFYSERPEAERFGEHSGLGLAICKQIVEAYGGTIVAENRVEQDHVAGARFIVLLPMMDHWYG